MRFTDSETSKIVSEALIEYCQKVLFPVLPGVRSIPEILRSDSNKFNATVATSDGLKCSIILNDGVVEALREAVNKMRAETIDDEIDLIASALTPSPGAKELTYRHLLYGAVVFILLHEFSHLSGGHFEAVRKWSGKADASGSFSMSELDENALDLKFRNVLAIKENFVRLAELEADATAINLMLAASVELFDHFCMLDDRLPGVDATDEVPEAFRRKAEQLMFLSATLGLSMIEAKRGVTPHYPYPLTRVFNVADSYFSWILPEIQHHPAKTSGVVTLTLDDSTREHIKALAIPAFFNAMDLAEVCCDCVGVRLADRFDLGTQQASLPGLLAGELLEIISVAEPQIVTKEARQMHAMRSLRSSFAKELLPFR